MQPWSGASRDAHGGGGDTHVHFHTLVTHPDDARKVVQVLKDYKRKGGNAALGIA